jgi:ABC-type dipeptide/oligopeptide/nickel transport system permease subunit
MQAAEPALPKPTPFWRKAMSSPLLVAGAVLVGFLMLLAATASLIAPYPLDRQFDEGLTKEDGMPVPPSTRFLLGTDNVGRDVLSRVLFGSQISLTVGVGAVIAAVVIGVVVGLYAGYHGGWVDVVLMRFTDVMMAIPALLLALALTGLIVTSTPVEIPVPGLSEPLRPFQRGLFSILLVIGVVSWTGIARVVRGQVLALKERAFVEAARAIGCSHTRILWVHILPNVLPAIIVLSAMSTAGAVALEAGLGYLGVGVPPPAPSWGTMISDGQPYLTVAPWLVLAPGAAIVLAVLGFNLLGQGLQDVLDPYHKRRA